MDDVTFAPSNLGFAPRSSSIFFDAYQLRIAQYHLVTLDCGQRPAHRVLGGGIGDEDDRNRPGTLGAIAAVRTAMALDYGFQRNRLLCQPLGNGGRRAGFVNREHADVVAAFVALHRCLAADGELRTRPAERGGPHTTR